ncbi:cell envelope integrity TolA C-terminal domain-containing protein [Providencia manganoxydans]|uniref:cell envelope integrity TolA C-terminal domain-containing protein n=1 Tax=Providencia manganoxydans TaxID=2923283 RepID=UPI0032DB5903
MKLLAISTFTVLTLFSSSSFSSSDSSIDLLSQMPSGPATIAPYSNDPVSKEEIDAYSNSIHDVFLKKFNNLENYKGKVCTMKLKFMPSGIQLIIREQHGDQSLCNEMKTIAKSAKFPKPARPAIYEETRKGINITLKP